MRRKPSAAEPSLGKHSQRGRPRAHAHTPSISTSSWLSVFSRSSWPPPKEPFPRARPTASISSIKTMHGAFSRANRNRSRTLDGPTPTNISRNSEPEMDRNGTPASPAVAFASRVLPVPGGPLKIAPYEEYSPMGESAHCPCAAVMHAIVCCCMYAIARSCMKGTVRLNARHCRSRTYTPTFPTKIGDNSAAPTYPTHT